MNDSCWDNELMSLCSAVIDDIHTFLCTFNFLNISVASRRCWFSKILQYWLALLFMCRNRSSYFFALYASNGRLRIKAIQYPLIKKSTVRKACTAASGTI